MCVLFVQRSQFARSTMSYERQTGASGPYTGGPSSVGDVGARIAGHQGGLQVLLQAMSPFHDSRISIIQ